MAHLSDAAKDSKHTLLLTMDTNVVVIWAAMGVGKDFRHISAHHIAKELGPTRSSCLPLSHSFTGCDTVSFLNGTGKREEGLGTMDWV